MHNSVLIAHAHKRQKTHRGGGRKFRAMQKDIGRFLRQDSARDVFFTSMIDLYALHEGFPGVEAAEKIRGDPYRRVAVLEEAWANETDDQRFIPHIQLHEYEAYLFTDISVLSSYYEDQEGAIGRLILPVAENIRPSMHSLHEIRGFRTEVACSSCSLPVKISHTRQWSSWPVIPAQAGIHMKHESLWIPACAGMTDFLGVCSRLDRGNRGSFGLCNNRVIRSVSAFGSPEMIDDEPHTAPSKRLIDFFPRYADDKSTVGVQAAVRIGLPNIRSRCPHFARWVERLEGLAD